MRRLDPLRLEEARLHHRAIAAVLLLSLLAGARPAGGQEPAPAAEQPPATPVEADPTPPAPLEAPPPTPERESAPNPELEPPPVDGGAPAFPVLDPPLAGSRAAERNQVRYLLENIEVRGNARTRPRVVLRYVPFEAGDVIDVDDPEVELSRYRLLGTGFFREVHFSLRKGSRRGWVVLIIEVEERNTIVVNDLWMGLAAETDARGNASTLLPYAGLDVAETNLAGTGITLGTAVGLGPDQLGLQLRFLDPAFLGGRWMTSASLVYNDARDYFGNDGVLYWPGLSNDVPNAAPVAYTRFGGSVGAGRDLGVAVQLWGHYRLESVDADVPSTASHLRGGRREPLDFDIVPGQSQLSALRATLQLDSRDHPTLPTRGWFATAQAELALVPLGSDYGYERIDLHVSRWWRLPWGAHVVRLDLFGGAIVGDAPFFEQYYVGDFSDFLPDRILGLNFDRRPAPNFFDTAIGEVRYGHYALKLGGEYRIPLYRGQRSVYGIDIFASAGIFALANRAYLERPNPRFTGAARLPLDLTANFGFRMDTSAGGFLFAFSNVIGLLPLREGEAR